MMYLLYADSCSISQSRFSQCGRRGTNYDHLLSDILIQALVKKENLIPKSDFPDSNSGISLAFGKYGKPFFPDYPSVHFSISHSAGKAVCCVSDAQVGADLQRKSFRRKSESSCTETYLKCLKIAARFFPAEDNEMLQALSSPKEKINLFFRLWTIREAYLKLTGEGLTGRMDSFQIDIENGCILSSRTRTPAFFTDLKIPSRFGPGYCGALCSYTPLPAEIDSEYLP